MELYAIRRESGIYKYCLIKEAPIPLHITSPSTIYPVLYIFDIPSILRLSHTMSQDIPYYVPNVPSISGTCPMTTLHILAYPFFDDIKNDHCMHNLQNIT